MGRFEARVRVSFLEKKRKENKNKNKNKKRKRTPSTKKKKKRSNTIHRSDFLPKILKQAPSQRKMTKKTISRPQLRPRFPLSQNVIPSYPISSHPSAEIPSPKEKRRKKGGSRKAMYKRDTGIRKNTSGILPPPLRYQ